jgi:hypothetical protein
MTGALFAQTSPEILNGGEVLFSPQSGSTQLFQGRDGLLRAAALDNGALLFRQSPDGGKTFDDIRPDCQEKNLTNIANLSVYDRFYGDNILLFTATENGVSGLYALEFLTGKPVLAFGGRLDDNTAGTASYI